MTLTGADPLANVADGALPADLAQAVPHPREGRALHDFAASLVRSSAEGREPVDGSVGQPDAVWGASGEASDASFGSGTEIPVTTPVTPAMPLTESDLSNAVETPGTVESARDDAGRARNVAFISPILPVMPAATTAVTPDVGEPAPMLPHADARGDASHDDTPTSHIATMLAARAHRMQGALGSVPLTERGSGAADASSFMAAAPTATASASRVASPMTLPPAVLLPADVTNDGGAAQRLRATRVTTPFASALATESTAASGTPGLAILAAMPSGQLAGHLSVGDGAAASRTLSERVQSMTENGVQEARMRLMPAELGEIGIVVRKSPMQLSVSLHVARPEVLSLVQGTVGLLRDMLSQRHAGEVHVSLASLPQHGGDGASGNARERHARDDRSGDTRPGLALGAADRGDEAFRL
ncbi:flagellar hook-length control protein FliK [Pandoraea eparura]|nr:flagellar hook-length control protein FliK [Pandoraea eparura]